MRSSSATAGRTSVTGAASFRGPAYSATTANAAAALLRAQVEIFHLPLELERPRPEYGAGRRTRLPIDDVVRTERTPRANRIRGLPALEHEVRVRWRQLLAPPRDDLGRRSHYIGEGNQVSVVQQVDGREGVPAWIAVQ